ncbi:MAG TPA: hypothetical protein VHV79_12620 [Mycobacteriales bacterium]|nr:hypothetical protein [Mycobacteriales bacterium]
MSISSTGKGLLNLALIVSPAVLSVHVGDCVSFHNSTSQTVTVSAGGSDSFGKVDLTPDSTTPGAAQLDAKSAGVDHVSATVSGVPVPGTGLVTILPALPIPSSPAAPTHSPNPSHSPKGGSPKPSGGHSSTPSAGASSAPTSTASTHAKHAKHERHTGLLLTGASLPPLPPLPSQLSAVSLGTNPLVAPGLAGATPAPTSTASEAAMVVGGPIEPLRGDGRGLPAAIAILLVLGLITGWGRVLLASHEAVDDLPRVGHRL